MTLISSKEIDRQYRVLRQTLSMHSMLRDEYAWKAKLSKISLLGCSVIFCVTTLASDDLYKTFSIVPSGGHIILGIASVVAFILSLMLMIIDLKGQAALHRQAAERWSDVLAKYRKFRNEDDTWPEAVRTDLDFIYWEADRYSVKIPANRFNGLKSRYLRELAVSELKSSYPGCPILFLNIFVRYRSIMDVLREKHIK